jgi:glutamine amidotransferase PdxT
MTGSMLVDVLNVKPMMEQAIAESFHPEVANERPRLELFSKFPYLMRTESGV